MGRGAVYGEDVKAEAVDLVAAGRSRAEVAKALGIPAATVGAWVAAAHNRPIDEAARQEIGRLLAFDPALHDGVAASVAALRRIIEGLSASILMTIGAGPKDKETMGEWLAAQTGALKAATDALNLISPGAGLISVSRSVTEKVTEYQAASRQQFLAEARATVEGVGGIVDTPVAVTVTPGPTESAQ